MRQWLYQTVLREASRPDDLTGFLNHNLLIGMWPDLRLPAAIRQAWEENAAAAPNDSRIAGPGDRLVPAPTAVIGCLSRFRLS
jgi:hypothetical protein